MSANRVMIIRHAEKPIAGRVEGVRARGDRDNASLSALGWQRAGALVNFLETPRSVHIARPGHVFAVRFDRANVASSRRSRQTVRPLCQALGLRCDERFGEGQEDLLVEAVKQLTGTILIAWAHESILDIVAALQPSKPPPEWPDERFDMVWVFDRSARISTFRQVPQQLLAGDRSELICAR